MSSAARAGVLGIIAGLFGIAAAACVGPARAQAPDAPAAMLVFDGSGSMWARLEGDRQAKFYLARDALKAALGKVRPETLIGMAAFGHRRQGDCSDAQVIMAPEGEAGGERLVTAIEKHNPRGKSPLTSALREAAKALPKGSGPRSLIIVHDDLDNCGQDPCAVLAEIKAAVPNVVIHALGLGLKGEDAQRLQCLVKPTGGKLIDVQQGSSIQAAAEELLALASMAAKPTPAPAAVEPRAPVAAVVKPTVPAGAPKTAERMALRKDGPPALRLASVLAKGQAPLPRHLQWTIRAADPASLMRPVTGSGQDASIALPAGAYLVEVRDGLTKAAALPVTVAAVGETGLDIVLDAGMVRGAFKQAAAGLGRAVVFDAKDTATPVALLAAADLSDGVALPPGRWIVRLTEGMASRDVAVEVKAGAIADIAAAWPFSRLTVVLAGEQAGSRFPATVILYEDDPDAPLGRREVLRAVAGGEIVVAAGTYSVVVRQGAIEARDRVALQAGERVTRTINLAVARVTLSSRLVGGGGDGGVAAPVAYRLERLDVVPSAVFTANRQKAELDLPAGRYRIEARHGLVNARSSREVTLAAGQAVDLVLEQRAGLIRLVGPADAIGDVLWEILDDSGHPLWSTAQASPTATVQAGRYVIRMAHRGRRLERQIEVRAGDNRAIELRE